MFLKNLDYGMNDSHGDIAELVNSRIAGLRPRLLDLTRRNPLISTSLSPKSKSYIRVVDELPDVLLYNLANGSDMRLIALPDIDQYPKDEESQEFQDALRDAQLLDDVYKQQIDEIDLNSDNHLKQSLEAERALRDRVRASLGMPKRQENYNFDIKAHAVNNGISPSYDLPLRGQQENESHFDDDIQTLQLPAALGKKLRGLEANCRTWEQETGINVLHCAFGFVEWSETDASQTSMAPLVLLPANLNKKKTANGYDYKVTGTGASPDINGVFSEKLKNDFGIELPQFQGGSIEEYFNTVEEITPRNIKWRVRRQVVIGVFPSARMSMYFDLDPERCNFNDNEAISKIFGGSTSSVGPFFADDYNVDEPQVENKVPYLVKDADASQFSALVDIANHQHLAIEGPPGTGKSQTIVNAIAGALATGKRILFVSEKMAALEVVKNRLEEVGLGEFVFPLQAGRSNKKEVINSIRERLSASRARTEIDFQKNVQKFRHARDEISKYISVASQEFAGSGKSVHEIICCAIEAKELLDNYSRELKASPFASEYQFSDDNISDLEKLATRARDCYKKVSECATIWAGVRTYSLSTFEIDELFVKLDNLASNAKECIEVESCLAEIDSRLLNYTSIELNNLLTFLENPELRRSLTSELKRLCLEPDGLSRIEKIRKTLARLVSLDEKLQVFFERYPPYDTMIFSDLESLLEDNELTNISKKAFAERGEDLKNQKAQFQTIAAALNGADKIAPQLKSWDFLDISAISALCQNLGRDGLLLRRHELQNPLAIKVLREKCNEGVYLREQERRLNEKFVNLHRRTTETVEECLVALRRKPLLDIIDRKYSKAKKTYLAMSRSVKFVWDEAISELEEAVEWLDKYDEFCNDAQNIQLFGLNFKKLETDFEIHLKFAEFYDVAQSLFSSIDKKDLLNFLWETPTEVLMNVPILEIDCPGASLDTVFQDIKELEKAESNLEAHSTTIDQASLYFRNPGDIDKASLRVLATSFSERGELLRQLSSLLGTVSKQIEEGDAEGEFERFECFKSIFSKINGILSDEDLSKKLISLCEDKFTRKHIKEFVSLSASREMIQKELGGVLSFTGQPFWLESDSVTLAQNIETAIEDIGGFEKAANFAKAFDELSDLGFEFVTELYLGKLGNLEGFPEYLIARAKWEAAREVFAQHSETLQKYDGASLDDLREQVAQLDENLINASRNQIKNELLEATSPPQGNGVGRKSTWTEMSLIYNEVGKTRHIPVRDLVHRAGNALRSIKPCWMMSPLAVAQYLERTPNLFDLCIIDEASQMPPEDALGAMFRSKQVVVVGDTNQLPPSNFFKKMLDEEDVDYDEIVDEESILELANNAFRPQRRLRWHYRSRHADLIRFSNRHLYNDDLVVFPTANENDPNMGLRHVEVEGTYKAGTNPTEARAVVEAVVDFMKAFPHKSLGVVALNVRQRDLIYELFDVERMKSNEIQAYEEYWQDHNEGIERFFIKNLENVQGDERDTIFISTVYGPEKIGERVMQRFGPLNGQSGRRRLNVLLSRAKHQITTFTSLNSKDILATEAGNSGVYLLKKWLEFSKTKQLDSGSIYGREPDSEFEEFVIKQIRALGFDAVPQVGVKGYSIDIGVRHHKWPHGFIMAVECDGASFHSSRSARDRDRLRQSVLEGLGWKFYRIWSTDWFQNANKQTQLLRNALEERLEELLSNRNNERDDAEINLTPLNFEPEDDAVDVEDDQITLDFSPKATSLLKDESRQDSNRIQIGDTVRVRRTDSEDSVLQFTISADTSDPANGIVSAGSPIAEALIDAEEGEEVEILINCQVKKALVEKILPN